MWENTIVSYVHKELQYDIVDEGADPVAAGECEAGLESKSSKCV